jgi:hypothetical protein
MRRLGLRIFVWLLLVGVLSGKHLLDLVHIMYYYICICLDLLFVFPCSPFPPLPALLSPKGPERERK